MSGSIEARLTELGFTLPDAPAPVANYVPYLISGNLLYISGQVSKAPDGAMITGAVGTEISLEEGQAAAQACALNILAQAHAALGSLDRINQLIKLTGYVNAAPTFADHPQIINGASNLMADVLGDKGKHTRAAVGVSSLPLNAAVEIDALIAVASP